VDQQPECASRVPTIGHLSKGFGHTMQGRGHLTPLRRVQSGQVIKKRHAISPLVVLTCIFSVELPGIELARISA
jgi:hypothetical protein